MRLLTKSDKINSVFLVPFYIWLPFLLVSLFSCFADRFFPSNFLFGIGIVTVNLSWVMFWGKKPNEEEKEARRRKDLVGLGFITFSVLSFLFSAIFAFVCRG